MNIKKNISLIVGISVPIVMILLVAGFIYLPRFFVHPHYNFLYIAGDYSSAQQYEVKDSRLVKKEVKWPGNAQNDRLFIYDVANNQSREISFDDAAALNLDPGRESPDGWKIISGEHHDGLFPFTSGADYCSRYISGHNVSNRLEPRTSGNSSSYCGGNFVFLGWIR